MQVNDLKKTGIVIALNNEPYQVIFSQHSKTARGQSFVRTKLKNLATGQVLEKTFNASDKVEEANIEKIKANFLYIEEEKAFFMNNQNYDQFFLPLKPLIDKKKFLREGLEVDILFFNKTPINVDLPKKVDLKVIEAPPSVRGDSATTPTKTVVLETKAKITVPIFVKKDDLIRVNTDTGEYVERV
ncbi:elongation factor P [Patescibacteria group bacterium]|nr:elongation factor P [Patescibacteria group bacterium]